MRIRSLLLIATLCPLTLLVEGKALATPYWGPEEVQAYLDQHSGSTHCQPQSTALEADRLLEADRTHPDYAQQLAREAAFLDLWQVHTAGSDFGGVREAEHMSNIIQTDNTSESIWVWTRYFELTGDDRYHQNILDAFIYELSHRAYNEEGTSDSTTGYYRMYNCGWAAKAELKYRSVYGDHSYKSYGDSCASYIRYHNLIRYGNSFDDYVNPPVLSWALGNLYDVGAQQSNQTWMNVAAAKARDKIKVWVQSEPGLLGNETWAMAGGATMWGFVRSYLQAYPESIATWLPRYAGYMDVYSSPGSFQNAWNGWYALGHRAVGLSLSDPLQLAMHVALTDTLVAEDGDHDGGIPARPQDTDTMDQTWVSNYLSVFGLCEFIAPAAAVLGPGAGPSLQLSSEPNPFNASTVIRWDLPRSGEVSVGIFDVRGRRVAELADGVSSPGVHAVRWNGASATGEVPGGTYFVRLRTPEAVVSTRIIHIR